MMRFVHSIRARLALWHTLTLAALLVAFAAFAWLFLVRTSRNRVDRAIAEMSAAFETSWKDDVAEDLSAPAAAAQSGMQDFRDRDARVLVYGPSGDLIASSDS